MSPAQCCNHHVAIATAPSLRVTSYREHCCSLGRVWSHSLLSPGLPSVLLICSRQTEEAGPESNGKPGDLHHPINSMVKILCFAATGVFQQYCMGGDPKVTPKLSWRKGEIAEGTAHCSLPGITAQRGRGTFRRCLLLPTSNKPNQHDDSNRQPGLKESSSRGCPLQPTPLPHR